MKIGRKKHKWLVHPILAILVNLLQKKNWRLSRISKIRKSKKKSRKTISKKKLKRFKKNGVKKWHHKRAEKTT